MNKTTIFTLNRMADEYEAKAKAYRAVANDLMNGEPIEHRPRKVKVKNFPVRNYNGKHWMQRPENRARMLKTIRKMQKAKRTK